MSDDKTMQVYDTKATEYAELTDTAITDDPLLADFIAACPGGGRVLDLGCGPGTAAARMARSELVVDAMDASAEMVALAARNDALHVWQGTFDDISGEDLYDGIWASFSLLHAPRDAMPRHLAALHRALKPSGRFQIGTKLGTGERRDDLGRFYTYYTENELVGLLATAGFTVAERHFGVGRGLDGADSEWISLVAHG